MSFDVSLEDENGNPVKVPNHREGGTCVEGACIGTGFISGTDEAELNVTYNYSKFYYQHLNKEEGLRWIHEKKARNWFG